MNAAIPSQCPVGLYESLLIASARLRDAGDPGEDLILDQMDVLWGALSVAQREEVRRMVSEFLASPSGSGW